MSLSRLGLGTRRAFLREMMKKKKYSTPDEANQSVGDLFGEGTLVYKVSVVQTVYCVLWLYV